MITRVAGAPPIARLEPEAGGHREATHATPRRQQGAAGDLWIVEPHDPLRSVLSDALALIDAPATLLRPDQLRVALRAGALPRGLLIDEGVLQGDRPTLAATYLVDRLVVSTTDIGFALNSGVIAPLRGDARWLVKPFDLDEFFAMVRWLQGPVRGLGHMIGRP